MTDTYLASSPSEQMTVLKTKLFPPLHATSALRFSQRYIRLVITKIGWCRDVMLTIYVWMRLRHAAKDPIVEYVAAGGSKKTNRLTTQATDDWLSNLRGSIIDANSEIEARAEGTASRS